MSAAVLVANLVIGFRLVDALAFNLVAGPVLYVVCLGQRERCLKHGIDPSTASLNLGRLAVELLLSGASFVWLIWFSEALVSSGG